jgi:hypothetical protein
VTVVVVWATISGLVGHTKPNWGAIALIWATIGGIVLFTIYKTKRDHKRELDQMNAALPDWISLATDGAKLDGPSGQPKRKIGGSPCMQMQCKINMRIVFDQDDRR